MFAHELYESLIAEKRKMFRPKHAFPVNEDDVLIMTHRLENECNNLRVCMSKVHKCRTYANNRLNATKEDRDFLLDDNSLGVTDYDFTKAIKMAVQQIEDQLNCCPKFSPEWFELKEDLVELRIKLHEGCSDQLDTVVEENIIGSDSTLDTNFQAESHRQFLFRPISPLPSPFCTSSLSLSERKIVQPCAGRPITNLVNHDANDNDDEDDSVNQRVLLNAQHTEACNDLDKYLKFSKKWFAAKIKVVRLENKLEELDDGQSNALVGGSNMSFTSWSKNEKEFEAISYADDLECVMVAEALKQGCCISPSFAVDGNVQNHGRKCEFSDVVDIKLEDDEGDTYNEYNSIETQSPLESQFEGGDDNMQQLLDSIERDLEVQRDLEIQNYHAVIIQKYWIDQSKCRVLKCLKSRALHYQIIKNSITQFEDAKNFQGEKWSRWETFAAVLIQSRWRCYLKQKLYRANSSLLTLEDEERPTFEITPSASTSTTKMRELKSAKPQTMEELSKDYLKLSKRLKRLQSFTPEWTLVNVELKLIAEEMEYLYSEILQLDT